MNLNCALNTKHFNEINPKTCLSDLICDFCTVTAYPSMHHMLGQVAAKFLILQNINLAPALKDFLCLERSFILLQNCNNLVRREYAALSPTRLFYICEKLRR